MLAPRKTLWSTPLEAIDLALAMAEITSQDVVYDIGCGNGNFLVRCAQETGARCVGIEIDEQRAEEARQAVSKAGKLDLDGLWLSVGLSNKVSIVVGNALDQSYQEATVFFLYLIPRGLRHVLPLFQALPQPLRVVTYMAGFKDLTPVKVEKCHPSHQPGAAWPIYLYQLNIDRHKPTITPLTEGNVK